jgi:hypothetical protein
MRYTQEMGRKFQAEENDAPPPYFSSAIMAKLLPACADPGSGVR